MKYTVFFLFLVAGYCDAYTQHFDRSALEKMLSNENRQQLADNDSMLTAIYVYADSAGKTRLLELYSTFTESKNLHTAARSSNWFALMVSRPPFSRPGDGFPRVHQAVSKAVESGDDYLLVQCLEACGDQYFNFGKPETALFYYLKSADLRQQLGDQYFFAKNASHFGKLGVLLFRMEEYKEALHYTRLTLNIPLPAPQTHTSTMNTLGLAYQRLGQFDSAFYWYQQALQSARGSGDTIWEGIVSGNIGSLYFEKGDHKQALPLLWKDYTSSMGSEPNNAGNTLHRIALILLAQGKNDSALLLARRSLSIVSSFGSTNALFIRNACKALHRIFRKTGNADSAFYYGDLYTRLNDSIIQAVASNRADVAQARLEFEKTSHHINTLTTEKNAEKMRRNLLLAGILLLTATGWFYFRWQRQQALNRQQELLHQKKMAEAEANNAKDKLNEYTQHLISKNELIESLQQQLQLQNIQTNEELIHQTILTENDWLRFKDMFDKANPGFTALLKKKVPEITTAELRLATLIRLNVGNKHIASMLGTSADAVRKTKSRLRQRLQITLEDGLEEYIRQLDPSAS